MLPPGLEALIIQCAPTVAPATMKAIVRTESKGSLVAISSYIRKAGTTYRLSSQPRTKQEAISWAKWLIANGFDFDVGPAQVNVRNWPKYGLNAESAFDSCQNLRAGSLILTGEYLRAAGVYGPGQKALNAALSSYNTGNFSGGFQNGYVAKVHATAKLNMSNQGLNQ